MPEAQEAASGTRNGQVVPVILAGGVGSRLWPVSRTYYPKQFHALLGEHSFLQRTVLRAAAVTPNPPIIVCNEEHRFIVAEQLRAINAPWQQLILEPEGRNSAPAIALAAVSALAHDEEAVLLVLASDHLIADETAFGRAVDQAVAGAAERGLVTFGITPTRAETGYGYIRIEDQDAGLQPVGRFVEKPDAATAQDYLQGGKHLWNSGMFVYHAAQFMTELERFEPEIVRTCQAAMVTAETDMDFLRPGPEFLDSPSVSVDFAVMEKTDCALVLPVSFGWNDIGSWDAICDESPQDEQGNHFNGDVVAVDTSNTLIMAQDRLIGALGLDNLIIVETPDAVLVADRGRVQDVRKIMQQLAADDRVEQHYHQEIYRPWGSVEGIDAGERHQVKCIRVKPGASISLQLHHHRSEHWVVVKGTGRITRGEERFDLSENESTYIPRGVQHRLENPGKIMLELIEVQVGSYLAEDDIERLADEYGRAP